MVETKQPAAAGANPETAVVPFAQAPDTNRRRLVTTEIIETFALGGIDEVSVPKPPQVAGAILIGAQVFGTAPLAFCLEIVWRDTPVGEPAHATARRNPDRPGTGDVHPGNQVVRKPIPRGKRLEI